MAQHLALKPTGQNRVYLRRGATGVSRQIANEDILCDRLAAAGFDIVDLATTTFLERSQRLAQAAVLVSIDGSHVNHGHYCMKPGGKLITLIPADRFTMVHRAIAHAMGLAYGYLVIHPTDAGYLVDPEEILRTIDLMA